MVHLRPAPTLHLLRQGAGVVVPALVVPVDRAGLVRQPGELTDVVGQLAKPRLALAQRLLARAQYRFELPTLRDLLGDDIDTCDRAVGISQGVPVRDPGPVGVLSV